MKEKVKEFAADFIVLLGACCISAFSTVGVLIPNGLTSGGLTGLVRIVQHFVNVDFSIIYYCGTFIIIALAFIFLGWKELKKILFMAIMYPTVLLIFEQFNIQLLETKDILLAAVFCGVFSGTYVGLVFWRGYASAGTEALAKIVRKKIFPQVGLSKILLVIDAAIIIASAVVFGRNIALYALITQVIISKTSEFVMFGFESKVVQLIIITNKCEEIKKYVMEDLERGATSFMVRGEYTGQEMRQLKVLCSPRESVLIKKKLAQLDSKAFVTLTKIDNVWGNGKGFNDIDQD